MSGFTDGHCWRCNLGPHEHHPGCPNDPATQAKLREVCQECGETGGHRGTCSVVADQVHAAAWGNAATDATAQRSLDQIVARIANPPTPDEAGLPPDVTTRSILSSVLTGARPYDQAGRILEQIEARGYTLTAHPSPPSRCVGCGTLVPHLQRMQAVAPDGSLVRPLCGVCYPRAIDGAIRPTIVLNIEDDQ